MKLLQKKKQQQQRKLIWNIFCRFMYLILSSVWLRFPDAHFVIVNEQYWPFIRSRMWVGGIIICDYYNFTQRSDTAKAFAREDMAWIEITCAVTANKIPRLPCNEEKHKFMISSLCAAEKMNSFAHFLLWLLEIRIISRPDIKNMTLGNLF